MLNNSAAESPQHQLKWYKVDTWGREFELRAPDDSVLLQYLEKSGFPVSIQLTAPSQDKQWRVRLKGFFWQSLHAFAGTDVPVIVFENNWFTPFKMGEFRMPDGRIFPLRRKGLFNHGLTLYDEQSRPMIHMEGKFELSKLASYTYVDIFAAAQGYANTLPLMGMIYYILRRERSQRRR